MFERAKSKAFWASVVAVGLMATILWLVGPVAGFNRLLQFPIESLVWVFLLLFANLCIVSFRFWRILNHFGHAVSWSIAFRSTLAGHLAGQFFISLFGQVAGRQLGLHNCGISAAANASILAYERVILMLVSGASAAIGLVYLYGQEVVETFFKNFHVAEVFMTVCGGSILSWAIGFGRYEEKVLKRLMTVKNIARVVEVAFVTMLGLATLLMVFVICVSAFANQLSFAQILASAAVISFAASIPITVNGWGVREVAAIYVLGGLGVPVIDAVTVSVVVGLCSTLAILVLAPYFIRRQAKLSNPPAPTVETVPSHYEGTWLIAMLAVVFVQFQQVVTLPGGSINLNLSDPFAILSLAVVFLHAFSLREAPKWRLDNVNVMLLSIGLLLVVGFIIGFFKVGFTQWAFGGRVIGWFVLLGYLSSGYLLVSHFGFYGLRRLAESLAAIACFIVMQQVIIRLMPVFDIDFGLVITPNFEGYAGNRNAFSFQLVAILALLLGLSRIYREPRITSFHSLLFPFFLGVVLLGLLFAGSRAGWGVACILLIVAVTSGVGCLRKLIWSSLIALIIWAGIYALPYFFSTGGVESISMSMQSQISGPGNDIERWSLLMNAFEQWKSSPIFGIGLGVFIANSTGWLGYPQVIHSTPIWILTEFGIVGVVIFSVIFFSLARSILRRKWRLPANSALILLLLAFLVFSFVHEMFFQRIFWLILGALLSVRIIPGSRWHGSRVLQRSLG